jgi:hypothetical protein
MKKLLFLLFLTLPSVANAAETDNAAADDLDGKHEVGLSVGRTHNLSGSRTDLKSTHVTAGYGLFRSNRQQWLLEGSYERTTSPVKGDTFGLMAVLRYHLASHGNFRPFVQAGAGVISTNLNIPEISGHLQFHEKLGAGARYRLGRDLWLLGEANLYHVSNADLQDRNRGLNEWQYAVGVQHTF